jgi:hypothetical protein
VPGIEFDNILDWTFLYIVPLFVPPHQKKRPDIFDIRL